MKRSYKAAGIFAALTLGVAGAALAHPGQAGGGMGMHGKHSMTPEARGAQMEKVHAEMQKRATVHGEARPGPRAPQPETHNH